VTIRENTERPETVEVGANTLAGYSPGDILRSALKMLAADGRWQNPFGDGTAGRQIVDLSTGVMPAGDYDYGCREAIEKKLDCRQTIGEQLKT
jgi:hypothetical protein